MDVQTLISARPRPEVRSTAGVLRGLWRDTPAGACATFLGVPYAQAPVGDLSFAAPRRRTAWEGVRDAATPGPTAQIEPFAAVTTIPEPSVPGDDILNLNVFTPAPGDRSARLPVLVWIHGGGYLAGCQNSPWYDGATFTAEQIVVVSVGYRLGAHGWLHLEDAPDNRGNRDWVAALTWVAENIEAFGGDPAQVTVAGQSAGGGAVLDLLATPAAAGLFARAMPISPALANEDPQAARAVSAGFTRLTGLPATAAAAATLGRRRLHEITTALTAEAGGRLPLAPFTDGEVLPVPVLEALRTGAGAGVGVLIGATSNEFALAGAQVPEDVDPAALAAILIRTGLGVDEAQRLAEASCAGRAGRAGRVGRPDAAAGDLPPGRLVGQTVTDLTFRGLVRQVAQARSAARGQAPTWVYEFAWPSAAAPQAGLSVHCLDLPFWWNCLDGERVEAATGPKPPQHLADTMHAAMAAFVRGDDPGWPAWDGRTAMRWDEVSRTDADPYARVIGRSADDAGVS